MSNSLFAYSRKFSLSSGRRHLYKSENWNFFFCLRFLASGHLMHDKWLLVIKFANQQKIWSLTEQQNSGDRFCHISNCVRVSKLSENTCRLTLCPPSPWSIFVHVSLVNGWRPLMRIILVDGLLCQQTLFQVPVPVRLRESWLYQETVLKIQKLLKNVCETQSLLLTYLGTLSEDGNIFWTNWCALFTSYVCSLFSRIGYGKVLFLSL